MGNMSSYSSKVQEKKKYVELELSIINQLEQPVSLRRD